MTPVEQIKERIDIVEFIRQYLELRPAGRNFKGVCPFHKEKTPSFMVSPERQTWHCFGSCSEGGDVFSFLMKYENIEFYEALKILAEKAGVELKKVSPSDQKQFGILYDINESAKEFFKSELEQSGEALEYIKKRALKGETIKEFEIGYSPSAYDALTVHLINTGYDVKDIERSGLSFKTDRGGYRDRFRSRLMFPIYNHFGKVVAFSGRILPQYDTGEMGKYINSPETPVYNKSRILYGFHKSKGFIREQKTAVMVEGQMDFLMSWQDGVKNAVAVSGTALTSDHLKALRRYAERLVFCFDADDAGIHAIERGVDLAQFFDFDIRILELKDVKDPGELVEKNPGEFYRLLAESLEQAMEFFLNRYLVKSDSSFEQKKGIRLALAKVKTLPSPVERMHWIKEVSGKTGIDEHSLVQEMEQISDAPNFVPFGQRKETEPENPKEKKSRQEAIAERIMEIISLKEEYVKLAEKYQEYFPGIYKSWYRHIAKKEEMGSKEEKEKLDLLIMKSGLAAADVSDKEEKSKIEKEFHGLLEYLKKESLKDELQNLSKQMRRAEEQGNNQEVEKLITRIDEISKLIHN